MHTNRRLKSHLMKIMCKARKLNEPVGLIGQLNLDVIGRLSVEP